jgi:hypothetical protein
MSKLCDVCGEATAQYLVAYVVVNTSIPVLEADAQGYMTAEDVLAAPSTSLTTGTMKLCAVCEGDVPDEYCILNERRIV